MSTSLPRISVTLERNNYELLDRLAKSESMSISEISKRLILSALELSEDMTLVDIAEKRLKTFVPNKGFSSRQLLKWNRIRRRKNR